MSEAADEIAMNIRQGARQKDIATLDATQFWASIKEFRGTESVDANKGENVAHWHHYEPGETRPFLGIGIGSSSELLATGGGASSMSR